MLEFAGIIAFFLAFALACFFGFRWLDRRLWRDFDRMENEVAAVFPIYRRGERAYCASGHFLGTINRDIFAHERMTTAAFDFAPDNQQQPQTPARCRICGGQITRRTPEGTTRLVHVEPPLGL